MAGRAACAGYPCSEDNSCSNGAVAHIAELAVLPVSTSKAHIAMPGTAWLCNGAQPLGLVRKARPTEPYT